MSRGELVREGQSMIRGSGDVVEGLGVALWRDPCLIYSTKP